jgi:hypothetical protein
MPKINLFHRCAPLLLLLPSPSTSSDNNFNFFLKLKQYLGHLATLTSPLFNFPKAAFRYLSFTSSQVDPYLSSATMSSAVDNLADNLANANIQDPSSTAQDTVLASAAEGRRLYIGNLAYATTEGELKEFFKDYKV